MQGYISNNSITAAINDNVKGVEAQTELKGAIATAVLNHEANEPDINMSVYFDIITEHSIKIDNQITDNYLENNTAVQDTIAHSPIIVTLQGAIAELVYTPSTVNGVLNSFYDKINGFLGNKFQGYVTTDKLTVIPALLPQVDNVTQMAKNAVVQIEASKKRYEKIVNNLLSDPQNRETRLEDVYNKLLYLRETNAALIVQTPFTTFQDMYIQSISFTQGNENFKGDISLTLKQLKFSEVSYTEADKNVLSKYAEVQRAQEENIGIAKSTNSILYDKIGKNAPYKVYEG